MASPRLPAVLASKSCGALRFLEPVHLFGIQRVLVTFPQPADEAISGAALSESSLTRKVGVPLEAHCLTT